MKIQKTLDKFQTKLENEDYYEAHQTLRSIINRNIRFKEYDNGIELLYEGAMLLFKCKQQAMGGDLCNYLIEVYNEGGIRCEGIYKNRIIQLISMFDCDEPMLKEFAVEVVNWSVKNGEYPLGDPDIHHALGVKMIGNEDFWYEVERHLLLGNSQSVKCYIEFVMDQDSDKDIYITRCVLNYLFIENVKSSGDCLDIMLKRLIEKERYELIDNEKMFIFESKLLNFCQLLIKSIDKGDGGLFKKLIQRYDEELKKYGFEQGMRVIGEMYFGIKMTKSVNLLDMFFK